VVGLINPSQRVKIVTGPHRGLTGVITHVQAYSRGDSLDGIYYLSLDNSNVTLKTDLNGVQPIEGTSRNMPGPAGAYLADLVQPTETVAMPAYVASVLRESPAFMKALENL
jgi:hypothetical protein